MDKKKIIIIGLILLITACALIVLLTSVNYERIYITPNGTSIEVPANQTEYSGNVEGAKIWNWDNGMMVTYNNHEDPSFIQVTELGFSGLNSIIKNGEKQNSVSTYNLHSGVYYFCRNSDCPIYCHFKQSYRHSFKKLFDKQLRNRRKIWNNYLYR